MSGPLQSSLHAIRVEFPSSYELVDELAADAALAVARSGDLEGSLHRLLTLVGEDRMMDSSAAEVFDLMGDADWQRWDMPAVQAISAWADAWWATALYVDVDEKPAGDVLGQLVHLELPLTRWLSPWMDALDGPGAQHLAVFIIDGSDDPGWSAYPDLLDQTNAWTRTEAVVNGFMMIGGMHLQDGQLSEILDRVIVIPGLH